MNLYTNFINTILFLPNPYENLNRTLPTSLAVAQNGNAVNGKADFNNVVGTNFNGFMMTCNACHMASPSGSGSNLFVGAAFPPLVPQPLKKPHLRNIYQKLLFTPGASSTIDGFGMDHDGNVGAEDGTTATFLKAPTFAGYTAQQKADMNAYTVSFDTGTAPAVGYTRTLTKRNVTSTASQTDWALLQSQAAFPNIDLVVNGTLQGQVHGLLYQPSTTSPTQVPCTRRPNYRPWY